MTDDDHEYRAFLKAILDNPADDLPRLAFADWLDENAGEVACGRCIGSGGEPYYGIQQRGCPTCSGTTRVSNGNAERAEFIRVQCELAQTDYPDLRVRERELFALIGRSLIGDK